MWLRALPCRCSLGLAIPGLGSCKQNHHGQLCLKLYVLIKYYLCSVPGDSFHISPNPVPVPRAAQPTAGPKSRCFTGCLWMLLLDAWCPLATSCTHTSQTPPPLPLPRRVTETHSTSAERLPHFSSCAFSYLRFTPTLLSEIKIQFISIPSWLLWKVKKPWLIGQAVWAYSRGNFFF